MKTFQIELTDFCNHDCFYCYKKQDPKVSCFFPINKVDYIYNEIQQVQDDKLIRLTGGEPFLAYDVFDKFMDLYCTTQSNTMFEIQTNLTLPTDKLKAILDKLVSHNKHIYFLISVQTYKQALYEEITQVKGTFKTLVQNLNLISKYDNVTAMAHVIVSKQNVSTIQELKKILMFIKATGINIVRINSLKQIKGLPDYKELLFNKFDMLDIFQYAFSLQEELKLNIKISYQAALPCDFTEAHFNKYKDLLKLIYEQYSYNCKAGENMFSIDMEGNIKPCAIVPKSFCEGNVFEESLQSIMDTKFDVFKTLPTPDKCLSCKYYKQYCNGGCKYKEYNMQEVKA